MLGARSFFRDPLGFVRAAPGAGALIRFSGGAQRYAVVRDPAVAWNVLVTDGAAFPPGKWKRRLRRVVGDALNTLHGEAHRERRLTLAPAFGRAAVARHNDAIVARAAAAVDAWPCEPPFVLRDRLDPLSIELAATVIAGPGLARRAPELARLLRDLLRAAPRLRPPVRPTAGGRALVQARQILREVVDERRRQPPGGAGDALDALLRAGLPDHVVRGDLLAFLLAAIDEPPAVLEAAAWLLAAHPDVEDALHRELDEVVGDSALSAAHLPQLPQLAAVIAETLRLFPPARHIDRCPVEDRLVGGEHVRRGTNVVVSPLVLQNRDGEAAFSPGRWEQRGRARDPAGRGSYLPFGAGVHACIGEPLARLIMSATLASVVRRGRIEVAADAVAPAPAAPPLTVRLVPR
jgi:cytochrome P450